MLRIGVPELALDDDQRHALMGHLDGMGVAELVPRKASPHPASRAARRSSERAAAADHVRPGRAVDDAEQRSDRQLEQRLEPWRELLPGPIVHADLPAATALAAPYRQRAAAWTRSASASPSA
jgi:hypothetical protein